MTNLLREGGKGRRLFEIEVKNERKKIWQWVSTVAAGRPPEACPIPASPKLSALTLCSVLRAESQRNTAAAAAACRPKGDLLSS